LFSKEGERLKVMLVGKRPSYKSRAETLMKVLIALAKIIGTFGAQDCQQIPKKPGNTQSIERIQ